MTPEQSTVFTTISAVLGPRSKAALAVYSPAELRRRLSDAQQACDWPALHELHTQAKQEYNDLRVLEKSILTRASPVLPAAIRLGLKQPDVSLQDYEDWFGSRASHYASPGEVSSMFSPAAYLTEMYREARQFYQENSPWHIDNRRPDLRNLVLSQKNLDTEVTALSLSNAILIEKARASMEAAGTLEDNGLTDDQVLEQLSIHLSSPGTPYHHHHARLRQVRELKDPSFVQLQQAPVVTGHLNGPAMAALAYDIPPALYELLTDKITEANAEQKYTQYFGNMAPEYLLDAHALRRWYGITDEELTGFLGNLTAEPVYIDNVLTTRLENRLVRLVIDRYSKTDGFDYVRLFPLGNDKWRIDYRLKKTSVLKIRLSHISDNPGFEETMIFSSRYGDERFIKGKEYSLDITWRGGVEEEFTIKMTTLNSNNSGWAYQIHYLCQTLSPALFVLKLNKAIRLYKATGLSPRALEDIVNSVDPNQITDETLTLLFRTSMLMKRYAISHQDALVMARGKISLHARAGEISQWDWLFNCPPLVEGGWQEEVGNVRFRPDFAHQHADIKATLKRAFGTDDDGLYQLKLIYHDEPEGTDAYTSLNHAHTSDLYTLSLWARLHGLSQRELRQLLKMLGLPKKLEASASSEWNALLEKLSATVGWMNAHNWRVSDLQMMTRDVTTIPLSTEIANLLAQLEAVVSGVADTEDTDERIRVLAPVLAAVFNLGNEAVADALLRWADKAAPGDASLDSVWRALRDGQAQATGNSDQISAPDAPVNTQAFAYGLAQMALIYHASGITPDAFSLFSTTPARLGALAVAAPAADSVAAPTAPALARNLYVIKALSDAAHWLKTLPDASGASGSVLAALSTGQVAAALLAQATGLSETLVSQAMVAANANGDLAASNKLASYDEIRITVQWLTLAQAFNVTPADMGLMLTLNANYQTSENQPGDGSQEPANSWAVWKRVADAFSAGLTMAEAQAVENLTAPALSAALSGYVINIVEQQQVNIASREMLFRYLLADNLNGSQVRTTSVAETIASLQVFIHRVLSLSLNTGDVSSEGTSVRREALDRQFFRDWVQWNARYSTWAAGKKLMYYPENYIDPTVRLGQTRMMDDMLQVLGQAQVNTDTVGDAFMGYLTGFEEVANLETISAYHDSIDPAQGKTWFIGQDQGELREFWWRTVDENKRDKTGTKQLPANAWTGWERINSKIQPWGNNIRPVLFNGRLYVVWMERQTVFVNVDVNMVEETWSWSLKISGLRYDGNWTAPVIREISDSEIERVIKSKSETHAEVDYSMMGFLVSEWPGKECILVAIYNINEPTNNIVYNIYADFSMEPLGEGESDAIMARLKDILSQLNDSGASKVINEYSTAGVVRDNRLISPGSLPEGYTRFELNLLDSSVRPADGSSSTETIYDLSIKVKGSATQARPWAYKLYLAMVYNYPEIAKVNAECQIISSEEGVGLVLVVGQDFYFICNTGRMGPAIRSFFVSIGNEAPKLSAGEVFAFNEDGTTYSATKVTRKNEGPVREFVVSSFIFVGMRWAANYIVYKSINPSKYLDSDWGVKKDLIGVSVDDSSYTHAAEEWAPGVISWSGEFQVTVPDISVTSWDGKTEHLHTVKFEIDGACITYKIRVYQQKKQVIQVRLERAGKAQYLSFNNKTNTRLNTLFAQQLTERATTGIDTILSWDTQNLPEPEVTGTATIMDFSGANAIYFWELFYYTPMMIMQRFLQEERFDLSEKWLKYVFSPVGYIEHGNYNPRLWNVRPLEEDTSWNKEPLKSYDPDAVAQNDPMHYKLNAFMRLLDITIGKGDAAYRKLERDTLAEAKIWYGRALDLLGEAPWIEPGAGWTDPTLSTAASQQALFDRLDALSDMALGKRRTKDVAHTAVAGTTLFLPEANDKVLGYWETLRLRLYNLRHNLTLDGQPMNLPMYAPAADPKALLAAAVAAEGGAGSQLPQITAIPALRFTPLLESARSMASQLIQFGSSMQQILLSQSAEALSELLNTQGAELAASSVTLQKHTLDELAAERLTLERSIESTTTRLEHYRGLYQENVNARELQAMNLSTEAQNLSGGIKQLYFAGALASLAPNVFGLANGGMDLAGPSNAAGIGLEIVASDLEISSNRITLEEQYRRRREEWDIQYRSAEKEIAVLHSQLDALTVRETSAQMQIAHMETQSAQAQAQLALFQEKFTGKAMYSWMRGRLATVFYQYYDLTASLCLMAQKALQWEKGDTTTWLKTGTWDGAWAGLMSGESLMLSLAQMEMAWMKHQKRELEVTRTVSLASFFEGRLKENENAETSLSLTDAINQLLAGVITGPIGEGSNRVELLSDGDGVSSLGIHFNLKALELASDFENTGRIRSIAVSLPALLGPYQDVRGRLRTNVAANLLPVGCNECAISHALQDNGMFSPDGTADVRSGGRWRPFEGMDVNDESGMTLSFTDATGGQKALLERLNDVILHIQLTVR